MPLAPTPLVVRIDEDRKAFFKQQALARGMSLSGMVLRALDAYLEIAPPIPVAPPRKLTDAEKEWFVHGAFFSNNPLDKRPQILTELLRYLPRTGTFNARAYKRDILETAGGNMAQYRQVLDNAVRRGKLMPVHGSLCYVVTLPMDLDAPPPGDPNPQPQPQSPVPHDPLDDILDGAPPDAGNEAWLTRHRD